MNFNAMTQRNKEVKVGLRKTVGRTRLRRVQFPDASGPNCVGARVIGFGPMKDSELSQQTVPGVTPETTRGTRVLPVSFSTFPHTCDEFDLE
jgi:hypothetical protein